MVRVFGTLLGFMLFPSILFAQEITAPVAAPPPPMLEAPTPSSEPSNGAALTPVPSEANVFADIDDFSGFDLGELLTVQVETASRRSQRLADAPARIVVVTRSQIEQRQYMNLADLLADLPGIDVFKNISEETHNSISIRGNTGNNKFVILQDGRRLTPLTGEPLAIEDNYPLDAAKQVEVIYGPASALYGADAFTGIINIITHEGTDEAAARAAGSYGTTQYRRGSLTGSLPLSEHLRLKYGGHWHAADNSDLESQYPNDVALGNLLDPLSGRVTSASRNDQYSNRTGSYTVNASLLFDDKFSVGYDHRSYTHMTATGVQPAYALYGKSWWRTRNQLFFADYRQAKQ